MLLPDANFPQLLFPEGPRASLFVALGDLQKVYQRKLAAGRVEETLLPSSWNPSHVESLVTVIKNKREKKRGNV